MKYLKWILAILLACALSVMLMGFLVHSIVPNIVDYHIDDYQYWLINLALAISFGLFVFLSFRFTPFSKKTAALVALAVSIIFVAMGIMQHIADDGYLNTDHIFRYLVFLIFIVLTYFSCIRMRSPKA